MPTLQAPGALTMLGSDVGWSGRIREVTTAQHGGGTSSLFGRLEMGGERARGLDAPAP